MNHRTLRVLVAGMATALALGMLSALTPAATAAQDKVVGPSPDQTMPRIINGRVYAIDSAGPLVAVGGSFDTIREGSGGGERTQQWLFMFNQDTGRIVTSFLPQLRGPAPNTSGVVGDRPGVQTLRFAPDGQSLYVAGDFTTVNGQTATRVARLDLSGNLISSFSAATNNVVNDMALVGGRLVLAGRFTTLNGNPVDRMAAVNPSTGATDTSFNIPVTDSRYEFAPYVQEIAESPDGNWLAVIGNFETLGGKPRNQVGLLRLGANPRTAGWFTDAFSGDCASVYDDSWARGVSIDPTSSFMVISSTGAYRGYDSLCDTAVRMELPSSDKFIPGNQKVTWRNHTGGDTLWANVITESAVYIGGHQRWQNNPRPSPGGDNDGPGSVVRSGFVAIDPASGVPLSLNPGRDRGRGAEALHVDGQRLFIGSDTDLFNGEIRQRLAVLNTADGVVNPKPQPVNLPIDLYLRVGNNIQRASFDGQSVGPRTNVSGPSIDGIDWNSYKDGFLQAGKVHYFGGQEFFSRSFDGAGFGAATNLSTTVGYVDNNANLTPNDQPYNVAETQVAAYLDGRIYYRTSNSQNLFSRGYSLESGIIGGHEIVESTLSWSNARGLSFIGDWLYASWSDGKLYRFYAPKGRIDYDSRQLVDDGSSINWSQVTGIFARSAQGAANPPTPPNQTCGGGTPWKAEYFGNTSLSGQPATTRCEANVNYNYGSGAPSGTNVGSDYFSVRWSRQVTLTERRSIKLDATSDDGVRGYVDGDLVLDGWVTQNPTAYSGTSDGLDAGDHTVTIEYFENTGGASINASYSLVDPVGGNGPDNVAGDTTVTQPTNGQVITPAGSVDIAGLATDDRAVADVQLSVRERGGDRRWLQPDGSFSTSFATIAVNLNAPGTTSSTWTRNVTLPVGDFAVIARTVDAAGNIDPTSAYQPFSVSNQTPDTQAPSVSVSNPARNATVTSTPFTVSGTASDNVGVTFVRVAVYNRDDANNRWLQPNGTFGPQYAERVATIGNPGAQNTTWSLSGLDLPNGRFAFDVRARDAADNETQPSTFHPFEVRKGTADTQAPVASVSSPTRNQQVTNNPVQARGSATDNVGVTRVRVAVYNRSDATNRWLQPNGTWGSSYNWFPATLANSGATSTGWSFSQSLPTGSYAFDVKAEDAAGNIGPSDFRPFTVQVADSAAPQTTMQGSAARRTTQRTTVSGIARDNRAVRTVELQVMQKKVKRVKRNGTTKRKVIKRYLKPNGKWGKKKRWVRVRISQDLAKRTSWRAQLKLKKRNRFTYQAKVRAVDANGNRDRSPAKVTFKRLR